MERREVVPLKLRMLRDSYKWLRCEGGKDLDAKGKTKQMMEHYAAVLSGKEVAF